MALEQALYDPGPRDPDPPPELGATFVKKQDSWLIQVMSVFFWFIGRRASWMDRYWVAGLPYQGNKVFVPIRRQHGMESEFWPMAHADTIVHEITHNEQRDRNGDLTWAFLYIFSMDWRLEMEAEAFAVNVAGVPVEHGVRGQRMREYAKSLRKNYFIWHKSEEAIADRIAYYVAVLEKKEDD